MEKEQYKIEEIVGSKRKMVKVREVVTYDK